MPRYYKNCNGLYETSRTINGKRVRFRGKTCADVDRKIAAYAAKKPRARTLADVTDEWIEAKEREIRIATAKSYEFAAQIIKRHLGDKRVDEITPLDVTRFVRAVEQMGYSGSTVQTVLGRLKGILGYAVLCGDIDINPATEVHKSRNLPKEERTALTEEQERKVEECREGHWLLGIMLLYTGLRRGELLALTWQDVDRAEGVIHVTKKLNFSTNPPTVDQFLKSQNGRRDVPILAPLAAVLPDNRIGLVFGNPDGTHLTHRGLDRLWRTYCADAGLTDAQGNPAVTPHQFRHSYATICYEAGIDAMSAAAMMGDTAEVVSRIYTELRKAHHAQQAEQVSAFLELRAAQRCSI